MLDSRRGGWDSALVGERREGGSDARERLLAAAYELFSREGIQAVGIDAIIERSGVARQTMYRHFASKQELVLAFLERREELWTQGWLAAEVGAGRRIRPSSCWRSSTCSTSGSAARTSRAARSST